jgi:hypothetical protein
MIENTIQRRHSSSTEISNRAVHICCVVDDYNDANKNPIIQKIKEYVIESKATFSTRIFDSRKKSDDRNNIRRLPAFHTYIERNYIETFYPNTRPIQHIDEAVERYKVLVNRRHQRKEWFRSSMRYFMNFFRIRVRPVGSGLGLGASASATAEWH